jgi:hypothetical protein
MQGHAFFGISFLAPNKKPLEDKPLSGNQKPLAILKLVKLSGFDKL